jgi:hypothetical protein
MKLEGPRLETFNILVNHYLQCKQQFEAAEQRVKAYIEDQNPDPKFYAFDTTQVEYIRLPDEDIEEQNSKPNNEIISEIHPMEVGA